MTKFLKEFKDYFFAYNNYGAVNTKITGKMILLPMAFAFALEFIMMNFYNFFEEGAFFTSIETIWLFGAFIISTRRVQPSVMYEMPISYKRRVVYDFLLSLAFTIIFMAMMLLFGVIFGSFGVLLGLLISGGDLSSGVDEPIIEEAVKITVDPYGVAFMVLFNVTIFLVGMIITTVPSGKKRIFFCVGVLATLFVGLLIVSNLTMWGAGNKGFHFSTNVLTMFSKMPLPWLAITIQALSVVALFAVAIIRDIKLQKPQNY